MNASTSAPLWLRIAAAVYDLFPLIALWMLTAGSMLLLARGDVDIAHPSFAYNAALRGALLIVTAAYFVVSWARGGQTIGMRAWRLQVVANDGGPLSWTRAGLRFFAALLSLAAIGGGFLWSLFDQRRRCWHDIVARSMLVRVSRPD
ncbi:MAG: RDD family protein [Dokdonella sp.]|uniref:RDD family protein n=1 Tax=Dokdonella sp. TaxID=2291710 RepID=UPI003266CAD2